MSTTKYFSVIEYAKQLRNTGATIEQADIQASALWSLKMNTKGNKQSLENNIAKIDIAGMLKYMR